MIISNDLCIVRVLNGIQLVKPALIKDANQYYTIGDLNHLLLSFYLLNTEGETLFLNEEGARVCGYQKAEQSLGKTVEFVTKSESANKLISNCTKVIEENCIKIFEEENQRRDEVSLQFLSVKAPLYNDKLQIVGVMGCSIVLGHHSLSDSLSVMSKLGLLDAIKPLQATAPQIKINHVPLTSRELQCLKLTIKGYTAKRIAKELGISHRTVEEYITNIRAKMGATNKSELIEMTIDNYNLK